VLGLHAFPQPSTLQAAVRELEGVGPIFTSRTLADLFTGGGGASRMWSAGGALSADEAPGITLSSFIRGGRLRGYTPAGGDGSFPRVVVVRELQPLRVVSQMVRSTTSIRTPPCFLPPPS